ncbi:hypothetical protein LLE87_38145, partial [Paenibacillus polymyxa]|nr:hypothetical protein [Paenibacillus polymyxa]
MAKSGTDTSAIKGSGLAMGCSCSQHRLFLYLVYQTPTAYQPDPIIEQAAPGQDSSTKGDPMNKHARAWTGV